MDDGETFSFRGIKKMNYAESFISGLFQASEIVSLGLMITAGLLVGFMFLWSKFR